MTAMPSLQRPSEKIEIAPPPIAPPLIAIEGIRKSFRRGEMSVEVLHGISLEIRAGEFVAIMGASGSGKSTLMNLLGLLDRPSAGSYRLMGREVGELDADARATLRREVFGFIFQQYNLLPGSTAAENAELPAIYAGLSRGERHKRAVELLTGLGLSDRLDHKPTQLSGGQQQRVAIARALAGKPSLILADEPTGALDTNTGIEIMALFRELNSEGATIVIVTHDHEVAAQTRRTIEMRDGHIVANRVNGQEARHDAHV